MTREQTNTARVETRFGALYVHVSHHHGVITEARISSPGKFSDTTMGEVLDKIADALNEEINTIARTWEGE